MEETDSSSVNKTNGLCSTTSPAPQRHQHNTEDQPSTEDIDADKLNLTNPEQMHNICHTSGNLGWNELNC